MEAFKKEFFALVEKAEHIVITAHLSPDDDSIGSVMAMHEILTIKYPDKDIKILYSGEASHRHSIFANYKNITFVTDIADHISNTDLFVMLDVNNYARVSKQPEGTQKIFTSAARVLMFTVSKERGGEVYGRSTRTTAEVLISSFFCSIYSFSCFF
jgi:nanoRNase/pAp phosphatase (c-di-AMP/oligoRNAs hydrolase)